MQTSIRLRLSINLLLYKNGVWGEAPSKVAGAAAPDNKPLPEGKGFGVRDREIALLIKKIDFFDKLSGCFQPLITLYLELVLPEVVEPDCVSVSSYLNSVSPPCFFTYSPSL